MEELFVFSEKSFFNLGAFWMPIDQFDSECGSLEVTCNLFKHVSARRCLKL